MIRPISFDAQEMQDRLTNSFGPKEFCSTIKTLEKLCFRKSEDKQGTLAGYDDRWIILVDSNLCVEEKMITLIHEAIHLYFGIFPSYCINCNNIESLIEEKAKTSYKNYSSEYQDLCAPLLNQPSSFLGVPVVWE